MLAKRIIPCLDVCDGRVVKGTQFLHLKDAGDPARIAAAYEEQEADELCFLDITASSEGRGTLLNVVRQTAEAISMPLTVGGGVRTLDDVYALLSAGADKVSINTTAVSHPEFVENAAQQFGRSTIVVAIDAKHRMDMEDNLWEVFTHGGRRATGMDAVVWAGKMADIGAGEILLTSMDRDGTKIGYDIDLLRAVSRAVSVPVIASGGVGTLDHFYEALMIPGVDAALAASIFHYQTYTIQQVKAFLAQKGVVVREGTASGKLC